MAPAVLQRPDLQCAHLLARGSLLEDRRIRKLRPERPGPSRPFGPWADQAQSRPARPSPSRPRPVPAPPGPARPGPARPGLARPSSLPRVQDMAAPNFAPAKRLHSAQRDIHRWGRMHPECCQLGESRRFQRNTWNIAESMTFNYSICWLVSHVPSSIAASASAWCLTCLGMLREAACILHH